MVQMPPIPEALQGKFSRFDADLNPTHDQDGNELDSKVRLLTNLGLKFTEKGCCKLSKVLYNPQGRSNHRNNDVCAINADLLHI